MSRTLFLAYILLSYASLFFTLGFIKKEVSYILIPFYVLVLVTHLIIEKKWFVNVVFFIVNVTAIFSFTNALMRIFYLLFPNKKEEFPLQIYLEWQLVLSFIISAVLGLLFYKRYKKTIERKTNIFTLSTIILILIIDALYF